MTRTLIVVVGFATVASAHPSRVGDQTTCRAWLAAHRSGGVAAVAQDRWLRARLLAVADDGTGWLGRPAYAPTRRAMTARCRELPFVPIDAVVSWSILQLGERAVPPPPDVRIP